MKIKMVPLFMVLFALLAIILCLPAMILAHSDAAHRTAKSGHAVPGSLISST